MKPVIATWTVELNCTCPACKELVDLLDYPDFWDCRILEIAECRHDVEVVCPKCGHEFKIDCEY